MKQYQHFPYVSLYITVEEVEHLNEINLLVYLKYLLQYDEKLFLLEQKDQTLQPPKLELQAVLFQLIHKDQIPIYQDQINLLHEKLQMQNTKLLIKTNEFQKF